MFRGELTRLDVGNCDEGEHLNSLTTQYDETEFETSSVPIDHAAQPATSVMLMNSYFDFIYAKALCEVKGLAMKKSCYGCEINHPSQTHHDCLMDWNNDDDDEYRLDMYFDKMLEVVDENSVLQSWEDIIKISNISPDILEMHKMVISSTNFLTLMKTDKWRTKMKRMVTVITRLENRLFPQA